MKKLHGPIVLTVFVALGAAAHGAHLSAASLASGEDETRGFVPDGKLLRHFVAGQTTTVADYYWLQLIMVLGGKPGPQPKILPLAHVITDLDPEYGFAYIAAGLALSNKNRLDESNEILTKGAENASRWEIPFYLAYNYWYEIGDMKAGARWLREAATRPGHPLYVEQLAARLYANAGDVDSAIQFMDTMASQAPSEKSRRDYEERVADLKIERDLQLLERAAETFKQSVGRSAYSLDELPPFELSQPRNTYHLDPLTGTLSNDLLPERLKTVHALAHRKPKVFRQ